MTNTTNPGGWPDAERRKRVIHGVGFNPSGGGFSDLRIDGKLFSVDDILTPAEVAAQVAAARAEEREACAALADENNGCLSPRCDCMDACSVDEVGEGIAAAIRAALDAASVEVFHVIDMMGWEVPSDPEARRISAAAVAAFLRALPTGPCIALSPDHIAGISKMVAHALAAAVEAEAGDG